MTALANTFKHARYVIGENAVTGVAFALFVLIVLTAILGPSLVPYDPLASDTAAAMRRRSSTGSAPISSAATCSPAWSWRRGLI